ncbi:hypothetical protein IW261DRAFT_1574028 [Armillaria novae-zelandiae]|uniref:Secreted protein n=1 Tax=Armillaria novae-zelandiae TaxID=153914 RepID=A0AA39NKU4_9AGAR|nr:hypothetical protein IW261DRAFT_1574028 [Armillaria novae-zelandiae]
MVAKLCRTIQFTVIRFVLLATAFPTSRIYQRDDDPSSPLHDPDEGQDIQSVQDYMRKSIRADLATQNKQDSVVFTAEPVWRTVVVDTQRIGDDTDSDSAGNSVWRDDYRCHMFKTVRKNIK